ncbi:MAG: 2OG-Fe(II) oxygenase [Gammaproteobacteria bacterium]
MTPHHDERIAAALGECGWIAVDSYLEQDLCRELALDARALDAAGRMRPAGIGGAAGTPVAFDPRVRGDRILWLDPSRASPAEAAYLARMEDLRLALNRTLFLGLFEFECHYACYPPGAGYERHLDRHRGSGARTVSTIAYLNPHWSPEDGGALRLHPPGGGHADIAPNAGTLAVMLSDRIEHEVLAARRARWSITGWFRRRA